MQSIPSLVLVFIGALLTMGGDVFLKQSHMTNYWLLALGLLLYACGVIPVAIIFTRVEFGSVFLIWEAVTLVLAMFIATFYFNESFTTSKVLATLFALAALYLSYK